MIVDNFCNFFSELLAIRRTTLEGKFVSCYNLLNHFVITNEITVHICNINFVYLATFYVISFC